MAQTDPPAEGHTHVLCVQHKGHTLTWNVKATTTIWTDGRTARHNQRRNVLVYESASRMAALEPLLGTKTTAERGGGSGQLEATGEGRAPPSQEAACLQDPMPSLGRNLSLPNMVPPHCHPQGASA